MKRLRFKKIGIIVHEKIDHRSHVGPMPLGCRATTVGRPTVSLKGRDGGKITWLQNALIFKDRIKTIKDHRRKI